MTQRSFKLPDTLDALLIAQSERMDRPVSWVIVKALEAALSEANGASRGMQAGPAPVPSSEGVRSAASPRTPAGRAVESGSAGGSIGRKAEATARSPPFSAQQANMDRQARLNKAKGM